MIKATPGWLLNLLQVFGRRPVEGKVDQTELRTFVGLKVFKLTTSSPPFTLCPPPPCHHQKVSSMQLYIRSLRASHTSACVYVKIIYICCDIYSQCALLSAHRKWMHCGPYLSLRVGCCLLMLHISTSLAISFGHFWQSECSSAVSGKQSAIIESILWSGRATKSKHCLGIGCPKNGSLCFSSKAIAAARQEEKIRKYVRPLNETKIVWNLFAIILILF